MLNVMAQGKDHKIIYSEARDGDLPYSKADISRAKKELGYNPTWTLPLALEDYL